MSEKASSVINLQEVFVNLAVWRGMLWKILSVQYAEDNSLSIADTMHW